VAAVHELTQPRHQQPPHTAAAAAVGTASCSA
jgi:hypothetical protein